jgi:hypothetical protein
MCIDTAHLYGSGIEIGDFIDLCDNPKTSPSINPKLIHLNGNINKFGSFTDTHTSLTAPDDRIFGGAPFDSESDKPEVVKKYKEKLANGRELLGRFLKRFAAVNKILERNTHNNDAVELRIMKRLE